MGGGVWSPVSSVLVAYSTSPVIVTSPYIYTAWTELAGQST